MSHDISWRDSPEDHHRHAQNRHSYHAGVAQVQPPQEPSPDQLVRLRPLGGSAERILADCGASAPYMFAGLPREHLCVARRRSVVSRLGVLNEMAESQNSFDSPRGSVHIDTMQQGPDLQADSPRGSTVSGSSKVDAHSHGHTTATHQPHAMGGHSGGYPFHGQVLVDPSTGQHYIVPQTAFFQPMQPMYYPPPQATPMFYPYHQGIPSQGYGMPNGSNMVPINPYGGMQTQMLMGRFPQAPRSLVSQPTDDRREAFDDPAPPSPSMSMHSTPPIPRTFPTPPLSTTTSFAQQYRHHQVSEPAQPDDPESGFRRSALRSSGELPTGNFERQGSGERRQQQQHQPKQDRTPLYGGPPPWWAQDSFEQSSTFSDVEGRKRSSPPQLKSSSVSDNEMSRPTPPLQPRAAPPPPPVRMDIEFTAPSSAERSVKPVLVPSKSVRMDIDLSTVASPPEEAPLEKCKAAPKAPATAFTVNFDDPEGEVSLQDAARKSAQAKRILNRRTGEFQKESVRPSRPQGAQPGAEVESTSNKRYLLQKFLGGEEEESGNLNVEPERKDADSISEAGTFVIDTSKRQTYTQAHMMPSRILEDSDATEDSDEGSDTEKIEMPPSARLPLVPTQKTPAAQNAEQKSGQFLQELMKLRQMAGISDPFSSSSRSQAAGPLPAQSSSGSTASRGRPTRPSTSTTTSTAISRCVAPPPPNSASSHRSRALQPSNIATTNTNNRFSRGDGTRLSMKSTTGPLPSVPPAPLTASPNIGQKRIPFRAGGAPGRLSIGGNLQQQKEQEMNAWLRRKDYNPMKAAAEAKKAKELKIREDQFMSNRSISFHVAPGQNANHARQRSNSRLSRNRSQESLAEEAATQASQRLIAEYSRGVVSDISRLSQQTNREGSEKLSGLARAVDMLSKKCKKSIELIRSQNKGCLSVSVEDLLSAAAEPPRPSESLNEQLERLSDAFDAVQRYLEQYSLDGHDSPIPQQFYDDDFQSTASAFSNASLRSRSNSNETPTSSYRSKILAHANANKQ